MYEFRAEDLKGALSLNQVEQTVFRRLADEIERRLIARLEEIEGRVPNNDEVRRYAKRFIFPDGRSVFTWKGAQIIEVRRIEDPILYGYEIIG